MPRKQLDGSLTPSGSGWDDSTACSWKKYSAKSVAVTVAFPGSDRTPVLDMTGFYLRAFVLGKER